MVGFDLFQLADEAELEFWPDVQPAFELFSRVLTQWTAGMNGPVGLNYVPLFRLMDEMGVTGSDWMELLDDIRVMESEALGIIHAQREGGSG